MNARIPDKILSHSIIATTEPEIFAPSLAPELGRTVSIFDNSAAALQALQTNGCDTFYADFRELADRWTGQRFLRFIRERSEFAHVKFWMMAEHWHPTQEQWAMKCGAEGIVKRSSQVLAVRILGQQPKISNALALQMDAVDEVFGRYIGVQRTAHIESARGAVEFGRVAANRDAYIEELASKFQSNERRNQFLKLIRADSEFVSYDTDTTQPGDPWMTEVNKVFKQYAGALGARLIISKALEDMEQQHNHDRQFYVNGLTGGLTNPMRRSEFISAAREARLIS